ncbi:MAG: MmcQ/YjbR family DNA-binding protein [Methylotenera sp.]|nr:MmcQ/YjbR family DNA-binding protein [Flavobacterium sp.]
MNIENLRTYALSKPHAEESFPFGNDTLVFKINNKIFLLAGLEAMPLQFNVKCSPDRAIELREEFPENVLPGYHMNKKHWNTIIVDGRLSNKQLQEFIDDSYNLVKGKK